MREYRTQLLLAASALAFGTVVGPAPAAAQTAQAPNDSAAETAEAPNALETIVVTARRREENLQDVPAAITAVTSADLDKMKIERIEDLTRAAAGLSVNPRNTRTALNFAMRGQGAGINGGLPGVQTYFDEVVAGAGDAFYDIARIEVLRGPQGTLFGRNTTGGAVRIVPRAPTFKFDGYVQGQIGNYRDREFEGAVNIPVVDQVLAVRVAGNSIRRDGFIVNLANGQDQNNLDTDSVRGQILFRPSATIENKVLYSYSELHGNGTGFMPGRLNTFASSFPTVPAAVGALFPTADAQLKAAYDLAVSSRYTRLNSEVLGVDLNINHLLQNILSVELTEDITFRNITSYNWAKFQYDWDLDASTLPILSSLAAGKSNLLTEEPQILGTAFNGRLNWIIGGYYERSRTNSTQTLIQFGGRPFTASKGFSRSEAVYAQGSFDLGAGFNLTAGYRYTWDLRRASAGASVAAIALVGESKSSAPNWNLNLTYKPSPGLMIYLATRRGYKGGGPNSLASPPIPTQFAPETITDVEAGLKSDWEIGTVKGRLNIAAYMGKYKDIQRSTTAINPVTNRFITFITNIGKADIKGIEVELFSNPTSFSEFNVNYAYTDAENKEANIGQQLAFSPKHRISLNGSLYLPVDEALGRVALRSTYLYTSRVEYAEPNVPDVSQGAYGIWDALLEWQNVYGAPVDASLFVKNLTDKLYFAGSGFSGFASLHRGTPRTYGLQVRYRFGASGER